MLGEGLLEGFDEEMNEFLKKLLEEWCIVNDQVGSPKQMGYPLLL